jgi:Zn ribbon nucleic-acid-binding protein
MERKRKRNHGEFTPCPLCGGDRFQYCTKGRVQHLKCGRCGETSNKIKSSVSTLQGTKEHSE